MIEKASALWGTFFHFRKSICSTFPCFLIALLVYLNRVSGGMTKWIWLELH